MFFYCHFRNAFAGFDAETVANFTDKQMLSISSQYGIDMSRIRGIVDNSIRILEVTLALKTPIEFCSLSIFDFCRSYAFL